jgi:hypothetical protein
MADGDGFFTKRDGGFFPADRDGAAAFAAVRDGDGVRLTVHQPKNVKELRLFFGLRDLVCDAMDTAREPTKDWLLIQTKFADIVFDPEGNMTFRPWSIRKMKGSVFDQFFNAALPVIERVLRVSRKELLARYFDYLDPNQRAEVNRMLKRVPSPPLAPDHSNETETEKEKTR